MTITPTLKKKKIMETQSMESKIIKKLFKISITLLTHSIHSFTFHGIFGGYDSEKK